MHEYPTARRIVNVVLEEAERHGAKRVLEVKLAIGELTALGVEQVKFYIEALSKGTVMEDSTVTVESVASQVECGECGYRGGIHLEEGDLYHFLSQP